MKSFIGAMLALGLAFVIPNQAEECVKGPSHLYSGTRSTTEYGITCQRWDVSEPHEVRSTPQDGGHHNHCRNPDKDSRGTWCYTTDPEIRWQYCQIPKCDEDIYAVWAAYNETSGSASFQYMKADPEILMQGGMENKELFQKEFQNSQFKSIEAGKSGKEVFFVDIVNDYVGIFDVETEEVERFLDGEARNIYAIAQDFATGNIYYTNTKTKSVMVADREFGAQVSLYKSAPSEPRAIVVLHSERKLVFSTYVEINKKVTGAQIVMTDMSGRNAVILHKSPDVVDVTGLAADDERIYWTDYLGYASKVMSCRFDGSDRVEHYSERLGSFKDIVLYSDYIYATDAKVRYNYFDDIRYNIKILRKDSNQAFTSSRPRLPSGITILQEVVDLELETNMSLENCQTNCAGVCLPNRRGFYKCRCTFGYRYKKISGDCVPMKGRLVEEGQIKKSGR